MAWNPSPKVADCREIARKWGKEQIIIIATDGDRNMIMATYGRTPELCMCAKKLGDVAFDSITNWVENFIKENETSRAPGTAGAKQAG